MTKDRRVLCLFLFKNVKKTVVYPEEHMIILIGLIILINGNITKIAEDGKTYGRVYYYDYDGKQRSVCEIDRINGKSVACNCYDMLANRVVG